MAGIAPLPAVASVRSWRAGTPKTLLYAAVAAYIFIPVLAVFLYAFASRWTSNILPDGYTADHWLQAFSDARFGEALLRSFALATATAVLDIVLVVPAVYWQRVRNPNIRPVVEFAAAIPFSIPFVVMAFGLLSLTSGVLAPLQGTLWLLVPAHAAVAFSFVYWAVDNAMAAQNVVSLSEAASTCGAGTGTTLWRVILPNISPGIASGGILAFGLSFNELAIVQVLAGTRFETVPLYTLNLLKSTDANHNVLAVITAVTFVVTLALSIGIVYLSDADRSKLR